MLATPVRPLTYVLPLRRSVAPPPAEVDDLAAYLSTIEPLAKVVVVDGSPPAVFELHGRAFRTAMRDVVHVQPDPDLVTPMGKVGGVLTGLRRADTENVVIADDDVRYSAVALRRMHHALQAADVVRPQNYFDPLPWHARWDTARSLLNRLTGGDWPGTVGVRRSRLLGAGGYDGAVMFENLELVRTVRAAGGKELVPLDLYVARRPPTARQFLAQRVRQAYDELARPPRFVAGLAVLPALGLAAATGHWPVLPTAALAIVVLAELGRRRAGGVHFFPVSATLLAPAWVLERGLCTWLALGSRLVFGGVPYRGTVLRQAATPERLLRRRLSSA
jgi:hypothetical protein